jgi:hypothetical protein
MNQELYDILNEAGWYATEMVARELHRDGWRYLFPDPAIPAATALPATDLLNLLRLGGWDARPNRKEPTRVFVRIR